MIIRLFTVAVVLAVAEACLVPVEVDSMSPTQLAEPDVWEQTGARTDAAAVDVRWMIELDPGDERMLSSPTLLLASEPVYGSYLVRVRDNVLLDAAVENVGVAVSNQAAMESLASSLSATVGAAPSKVFTKVFRGFSVDVDQSAAMALAQDPRVLYVAENAIVHGDGNAVWSADYYGRDRLDQRALPLDDWFWQPDGDGYPNNKGQGVHVYVIDSGIMSNHGQFGSRVSGGYSVIDDDNGTEDCHSHGTHIAGTIGAASNGIAPKVHLHPIRVLDCKNKGTSVATITALEWLADNMIQPAVANMSYGRSYYFPLNNAVTALIDLGLPVVVSAGNDGGDACLKTPASTPKAITVGATNVADERWSSSNFGPCLDIFAPGSDILSTCIPESGASGRWVMCQKSGTSMAAPHVTGVLALYRHRYPNKGPSGLRNKLLQHATVGKVKDERPGSPNLIPFTGDL